MDKLDILNDACNLFAPATKTLQLQCPNNGDNKLSNEQNSSFRDENRDGRSYPKAIEMLTHQNSLKEKSFEKGEIDTRDNIGLKRNSAQESRNEENSNASVSNNNNDRQDSNMRSAVCPDQADGQATTGQMNNDSNNPNPAVDDDVNDEDAFIALCTDNSSVLNNNPSRRYYINKLYRPLNSQSEEPVGEQDDAILLYNELEYIRKQESTDERHSVQLTKILEDDDGDDDHLLDNGSTHINEHRSQRDDPLDRLQLTEIIESFDSFTSSSLIDSCVSSDLIMREGVCGPDVHEKPDSTHNGASCPSSGRSSANTGLGINSNHFSYDHHFQNQDNYHHHHQYNNNPHFQEVSNSNDMMNHGAQHSQMNGQLDSNQSNLIAFHDNQNQKQHHLQQQHHYDTNLQINHDNSSEISCFQPVSSSYMSPTSSTGFISPTASSTIEQLSNTDSYEHQLPFQTRLDRDFDDEYDGSSKLSDASKNQDLVKISQTDTKLSSAKARTKRKLSDPNDSLKSVKRSTKKSNTIKNRSDISSTHHEGYMTTNNLNAGVILSTKENQLKHINENRPESISNEEQSIEEASNSGGRRRNHSMNKYRRCTANARERIRMREINLAFEKLKKVVPVEMIQQVVSGDESDQASVGERKGSGKLAQGSSDSQLVKLTKINTLKLAVSYIAGLSELLNQNQCATGADSGLRVPDSSTKRCDSQKEKSSRAKRKSENGTKKRRARTKVTDSKNTKTNSSVTINQSKSNKESTNEQAMVGGGQIAIQLNPSQRIIMNQTGSQNQPMIIANGFVNRGLNQGGTLVPLQQQQVQQLHQKPHLAYANQQVAITSTNGNLDRPSFVTPVAVAILGIPTNSGFQGLMNESQPIQILGVHNPNQQQHHQQSNLHVGQQPQRIQPLQGNYSLVTQQPQQVTLTLNDLNGISVLRLTNPQETEINQQRASVQLHSSQASNAGRPQVLAQNGQLNYATISPIQLTQLQSNGMQTLAQQPMNNQQSLNGNIQFRTINGDTNFIMSRSDLRGKDNRDQQDVQMLNTSNIAIATTNTGIQSDCNNLDANRIIPHPANNDSNISNVNNSNQQQQTISPNSIISGNVMTVTSVAQYPQQSNRSSNPSAAHTNFFYLNPNGSASMKLQQVSSHQQYQAGTQVQVKQINHSEQPNLNVVSNYLLEAPSSQPKFEQMKFVTQFPIRKDTNKTEEALDEREASIRQLAASLATSIRPNEEQKSSLANASTGDAGFFTQNVQNPQQQRPQQPRRTYRFHNYDGNMITNHLYHNNNNGDKTNQSNQMTKKGQQNQTCTNPPANEYNAAGSNPSQRSRQNSLSSTCSTTSSLSSSVSALSTSFSNSISPNALQTIMVESPSLERNSSESPPTISNSTSIEDVTSLQQQQQRIGEPMAASE